MTTTENRMESERANRLPSTESELPFSKGILNTTETLKVTTQHQGDIVPIKAFDPLWQAENS